MLIPRYGAWGAALANAAFMVTEQLLYLVFTHMATDVRTFSREGLKVYASVVAGGSVPVRTAAFPAA